MKKFISSIFIFVFIFFAFAVSQVSARVLTSNNGNVTIAKGEVINDDLFIGAQGATINGTVNGDVFIGSQTVKIDGIINGNLHIGAQTIDLEGTIKGSVYAAGQDIILTGANISGSVIAGGQNLNIDKNSVIGGSVIAGGAGVNIDSQVKRNVYAGTSMLTIGPDARIGKNLYYAVGQTNGQATIDPKAKITGQVVKSEVKTPQTNVQNVEKQAPKILGAAVVITNIISFIGAIFVGLLYMSLFGKHFRDARGMAARFFWKSLGIGFVISIALVPVMFILLITIIGIPLAGVSILIFLLFAYLSKIIIGAALGSWIADRAEWKMSTFWAFAFGLLIIYLLKLIPVVGFITDVVVLWAGLGALTLHLFSKTE